MEKDVAYFTLIATFVAMVVSLLYLFWGSEGFPFMWVVYLSLVSLIAGAVNFYINWKAKKNIEEGKKKAENLFYVTTGKKADRSETIIRPTPRYDCLNQGITGETFQVKFWAEHKAYKGIMDMTNSALYMREPELLPVYKGESTTVWKEVATMHKNGMPKKVVFYDNKELPHRTDYLDEKGTLKKGSWRRREGIEEYWNPKTHVWEKH
jgi:hypothetical protein